MSTDNIRFQFLGLNLYGFFYIYSDWRVLYRETILTILNIVLLLNPNYGDFPLSGDESRSSRNINEEQIQGG